ncbi:hypothetical protein PsYK624_047840 [Phanerochaete sordida]|uniref:Uncharacterized protein n=1 Tax=Phanerochaete sordida TaxID=48140 RepID=A0A9P3G5L3_9APHY|nr:hypothetical protein PsYK624_047840 [Phanerochaete sordida]
MQQASVSLAGEAQGSTKEACSRHLAAREGEGEADAATLGQGQRRGGAPHAVPAQASLLPDPGAQGADRHARRGRRERRRAARRVPCSGTWSTCAADEEVTPLCKRNRSTAVAWPVRACPEDKQDLERQELDRDAGRSLVSIPSVLPPLQTGHLEAVREAIAIHKHERYLSATSGGHERRCVEERQRKPGRKAQRPQRANHGRFWLPQSHGLQTHVCSAADSPGVPAEDGRILDGGPQVGGEHCQAPPGVTSQMANRHPGLACLTAVTELCSSSNSVRPRS